MITYTIYCPKCGEEGILQCTHLEYDALLKATKCPNCGGKPERDLSIKRNGPVSFKADMGPGSHFHEYKKGEGAYKQMVSDTKTGFKHGEERLRERQKKDPSVWGSFNDKSYMKNRETAEDHGMGLKKKQF